MHAVVWIAIILGVIIVCSAIGIPYFLTHRRMIDHYEHDQSEKYLAATGRTAEDVSQGRTGRAWRRRPSRRGRPAAPGAAATPGAGPVADQSAGTETL